MSIVLLSIFYLIFPALAIYGCARSSLLDKIGAGILCYGMGVLMSVIGVVPAGAGSTQELFMTITVPLSIPLMLFSTDLKRWSRLAGKTLIAMILMFLAVLIAITIGYLIFRDSVEESWKVAGMLIGVYTGGTPNLNAIGLALKSKEHILVLTNTADMLACTPWFFFMMILGQRFFKLFLPPFQSDTQAIRELDRGEGRDPADEKMDFTDYRGIFSKATVIPLLGALGIAVLIFAVGGAAYSVTPKEYNMAALMLVITTLGIICSFVRRIRDIDKSFQLGQYIVFIFCVVVGSMADLKQLLTAAAGIMIFTSIAVYGSWLIHLLLCTIFRIDTDTVIITSVAALFSPPFVPVFASAMKNKEIIVSGLAAGIVGYAVGNYLGITYAYFLRGFM